MTRTRFAPAIALALASLFIVAPARADEPTSDAAIKVSEEISLRVRTFGDAPHRPPVVMLTGGPGFAGEQLRSTAEALSATRRVILPDQRGTGESDVPIVIDPNAYSFAQSVADLEAIREAMGVEKWALAGHSWGGLLAMIYLSEHPDRVASVALIAPAGVESAFWGHYQQNIFNNLTDAERQGIGDVPLPADQTPEEISRYIRAANRAMAPAMLANKDVIDDLRAEITPENFNPTVSLSMQDELQSYDLRDGLKDVDVAVRIIQGDADPVGRMTAQQILDTIPGSTIHIINACGHWPMLETPKALNAELEAFFSAN